MSWSSKRFFGLVFGAALTGSAMVGCSGNDSTVPLNSGVPSIPATGGVAQSTGTSTNNVAAAPSPQQVQVTQGGSTVTANLPANVSLTAGETVCVFGTTGPIQGLVPVGGSNSPSTRLQNGDPPGEIFERRNGTGDFWDTGVRILPSGQLSGLIVMPDGVWEEFIHGPLALVNGNGRLDIQTISEFGTIENGVASLPVQMDGDFPVDGGSTFTLHLDVQMPPTFANGWVQLRVTHQNGILSQWKQLNSGFAQFHDFVQGNNSAIPTTGVNTVEFDYSATHP
jgi:hypothetical protein